MGNTERKEALERAPLTDEAKEYRKSMQMDRARIVPFLAEFRYQTVEIDGKEFFQLDGYATTWNQRYEMFDMFGSFMEQVRSDALDVSLAKGPDVAFLTNHKGVTMARTTNERLKISKDLNGLAMTAFLNPQRQDVMDLIHAIRDKDVTEMSWAFMLLDGEWDDDYETFTITSADINRGDVSAVNFGANPYTSIWARAQEWARDAKNMPESVKRAVITREVRNVTGIQIYAESRERLDKDESRDVQSEFADQRTADEKHEDSASVGRSVSLYRNRLKLVEEDN